MRHKHCTCKKIPQSNRKPNSCKQRLSKTENNSKRAVYMSSTQLTIGSRIPTNKITLLETKKLEGQSFSR